MAKHPKDIPIVVMETCSAHTPEGVRAIQTGPNMTEAEGERIMNIMLCPDCWEQDTDGQIRMMDELNLDAEARLAIHRHVMAKVKDRQMRN